jgi:hypothetical protein
MLFASLFWPIDGIDFDLIKRVNLIIIIVAIALLAIREMLRRSRYRHTYFVALGALAFFSVVNYTNYFSFHGERVFLHLHDLAHYYLGSKYSGELGYEHLYTAMLRAEAELYDDHFVGLEARDLSTNKLVDIRQLLRRSDEVKDGFDPARWGEFKLDVAFFHQQLGPHWAGVLKDHGYNPTPAWTLVGSLLSNRVAAGSRVGITALALLDPLILMFALIVIGRTFGWEAAAWAVVYFCVIFGATFGWTGGAMLRNLWFGGLILGFCAIRSHRYGLGGGLLALAVAFRIFPLLFTIPLAIKTAQGLVSQWRLPPGHARLWLVFSTVLLSVGLSTLTLPEGWRVWAQFRDRIETQIETISPNIVGLTQILTYQAEAGTVTALEFEYLGEQRKAVHRAQLATVFPVVLFLVMAISLRLRDTEAMALGIPLLLVALNLAGYYFSFLILLCLVHRRSPGQLSALFAAEAVPYSLLLLGQREAVLYTAWSVSLLVLMLVLYGPLLRQLGRRFDSWAMRELSRSRA